MFVYFENRQDPRIGRLSQILGRSNIPILRDRRVGNGHAVFLPPGVLVGKKQWAAMGVADHRLQSPRFHHDVYSSNVLRRLQDKAFADLGTRAEDIGPRFVGQNRYRQDVYDSILGRSLLQNETWHAEWESSKDGRRKGEVRPDSFLRGVSPEAFNGCARAIAVGIANGERFDNRKMEAIHADILASAPHLADNIGFRRLDLNEAIEAHLASLVTPASRQFQDAGAKDAREFAIALDDGLAAHRERNGTRLRLQQYSTPFPIARAAFECLLPQDGDRLLEPTIGNGTLASSFIGRNLAIDGIELDAGRAGRARKELGGVEVYQGDCLDEMKKLQESYQLFVANPPFETLDSNVVAYDRDGTKVTIRRLDHQIAFEGLQKLDRSGRAFLVLPGDMMTDGKLDGARRFWDNYLRQTYHIAGSACVDGRLYRKMGAEFPVLIYALGPMRLTPLSPAEVRAGEVETLPLIVSHDELFAWADETRAEMLKLTGLPDVEPGYSTGPQRAGQESVVREAPAPTVAGRAAPGAGQRPAPPVAEEPQAPSRARRSGGRAASASAPTEEPSPTAPASTATEAVPAPAGEDVEEKSHVPTEAVVLVDDTDDDVFVRSYEPFSNCGEAQTKIQKSLQGLTYRALIDVQAKHGDIDAFVASKLNLPVEELGKRFSPEQIDGAALAFARHAEKRGFLFADLMGVGKGRELGMAAMAALVEQRPVIFWTEQPNLFTDFVARDLSDVFATGAAEMKQSGLIRPFIFNQSQDAAIRDENGKLLYGVGDTKGAKADGLPADANMILATYSQVQTDNGQWKVDAILKWARAAAALGKAPELVLDEVHKAAGEESKTGFAIERLVDGITEIGGTITFSSATPLKSGKNIKIYKPILPDTGMDTQALTALIESNPLALQEVLSGEMARMGTMISREIDTSGIVRRFISLEELDPAKHANIVEAVDRTAALLRELVEMSPTIDQAAAAYGSRFARANGGGGGGAQAKVSVQTTSPVSQFHNFSQYLMVAVKSAYDEDLILDAIAAGRKPVVVVENTGKEVLSRLAGRIGVDQIEDGVATRVIDRLPNMGDVLIENASKLLDVKIIDTIGNEVNLRLEDYEDWLQEFTIKVTSAKLDVLSLDPIDKIKSLAAKHDLTVGEITKRSLEAEPRPDGSYAVTNRKVGDKREIIRDFNNGEVDIVVMNRSAASGVSMHASPAVGVDLRPRRMIKLQLQSEITAERQIEGRTQRYGQVHDSEYDMPMSGFAADDRLCQLFNKKNRSLSATSTATRENRSNIDNAADLMNPVGESAVRQYLSENPHIAVQLGLPVPGEKEDGNFSDYARKLMGRLVCLPIKMQETVLSEVDTLFRMRVDALDARGLNPLKLNQHDWKATIEPVSTLIVGKDDAEAIGQRPLNLVRLRFKEAVEPMSFEKVQAQLERGQRLLVDDVMSRYVSPAESVGDLFKPNGQPDWSAPAWDRTLNRRDEDRSLGLAEISADEATDIWLRRSSIDPAKASVNEKRIVRALSYADFVTANLPFIEPGNFVHLDTTLFPAMSESRIALRMAHDLDQGVRHVPALITRVQYRPDDPLNLSSWKIDIVSPGQTHTETVGLTGAFGVLADMSPEERQEAKLAGQGTRVAAFSSTGEFIDTKPDAGLMTPFAFDAKHREHIQDIKLDRAVGNPIEARSMRNEQFRELIKHAFDDAPAGQVSRMRYALDGNMFQAVKISQGKHRLGEKAIYTTSNGEVRHGVILKNESEAKLLAKLEGNVAALSVPFVQAHPTLTRAFIDTYRRVTDPAGLGYDYMQRGEISRATKTQAIEDLALVLSKGLNAPGFREYAEDNFNEIFRDLRKSLSSSAVSEIYVGSDAFIEAGAEISKTTTAERPCQGDEHRTYVEVKTTFSTTAVAVHAKNIGVNEAHVVFSQHRDLLLFHKKSDAVVAASGDPKLLDRATNRIDSARLTKGVVGLTQNATPMLADILHKVSAETGGQIMTRGPIAGMQAAISAHMDRAHEYAVELANRAEGLRHAQ